MLRRGSAILTTIMLLFGMVIISFFGIDIVMNAISRRQAEGASSKAFYAAEGASEKIFLALKLNNNNLISQCKGFVGLAYFNFASSACTSVKNTVQMEGKNDLPQYYSSVKFTLNDVEITSRAAYQGTARQLYTKFCLPDCAGVASGGSDGCGGTCK